jgi:hypothetical protein
MSISNHGLARAALVLLCLIVTVPMAQAYDDLVVTPSILPPGDLGAYTGAERIVLGEFVDEIFAQNPARVGMGPQAEYAVDLAVSRVDYAKQSLAESFRRAGLLAGTPDSSAHVMDVRILRDRLHTHQTGGRFRLRTEVFLQVTFRKGDTMEGRVLACGNAETHAQVASKEKITQTFQIGFNDAVHKILNSRTLARLLGDGWSPAPAPDKWGDYDTTHIHRDEFYGPTDGIQSEIEKAMTSIGGAGPFTRLALPDFQIEDVAGKKDDEMHDMTAARAVIPEKIREHLNAFFPGAFESIERGRPGPGSIVVDGRLDKFRVGSFTTRVLVGYGAGKDKLEGQISINDAAGHALAGFPILTSNWGAVQQIKQGQIRDMIDQLARDLAYFLVKTCRPGYKPPEDLEILFDGTPYPVPQKS